MQLLSRYSVLFLWFLFPLSLANTEAFQIDLLENKESNNSGNILLNDFNPHNFTILPQDNSYPYTLNVSYPGINKRQLIIMSGIDNDRQIDIHKKQFIKLCWSAIDPISVGNLTASLQDNNTSIYLSFDVRVDSYPLFSNDHVYMINLTMGKLLFGCIPMELIIPILYILSVTVFVVFLNWKFNIISIFYQC